MKRPWRNFQMLRSSLIRAILLLAIAVPLATQADARTAAPSDRVTSAVLVRAGPSTNTSILNRLRPGDTATIVSEQPGWYEVELADGTRGFVSKAWTLELEDSGASLAASSRFKVHVIDVGTGLSVFVEGAGFTLLYDAGSQDDLHSGDENRVVAYLKAARPDLQRIDHLILSHPHKDHLQLMGDIFASYQIANVWDSGRVNKTDGYCHFLKAAMAEPNARYHDTIAANSTRSVTFSGSGCNGTVLVRQADKIDERAVPLGTGAQMFFLYRDAANHPDPNENTLVVRLELGDRAILLAGDAEGGERLAPSTPPHPDSIEGQLIACCAAQLKADALVVGHHGSLTSSRKAFLDAVGASVFAISSGPYPYRSVRLPDADIVSELERRGQVFRTDRQDEFRLGNESGSCEFNPRKIGSDVDETPGGCDNILIEIEGSAPLRASYSSLVD